MADDARMPRSTTAGGSAPGMAGSSIRNLLDVQSARWERGEPVAIEELLGQLPGTIREAEGALDLIHHEVVLRQGDGESPKPGDYLGRFPHLSHQIERIFEVERYLGRELSWSQGATSATSIPDDAVADNADVPSLPLVSGYAIEGVLGRGGMGVVYRARHLGLNRPVALKMILAEAHAAPDLLARFRAEADAVAHLHHPNIVQIYDVGESAGRPYLTFELVEGKSLAAQVAGTPQTARDAARLVETLARAIHHAHGRGVVHRDLKPANVLLTPEGEPKVTDFGLAKRLFGDQCQTGSGSILGTPSYLAPEQASGGSREVGVWTDVYGLGAILYELLSGRPPFKGETPLETLRQVTSAEVVPPGRLVPSIPRDLETVCLKCLEKEPRRRIASARELADELGRFLGGEPVRAHPVPAYERLVRWAVRRPAIVALLAMVALSGIGAVVGSLWYLARLREHNTQLERQRSQERRISTAAMDILNKLVFDLQRDLGDTPGTQGMRERFLHTALDGLQRVVGEGEARDRAISRDYTMAVARIRLGHIYLNFAQDLEAQTQFEQACRIGEEQAGSDGDAPLVLADAYWGLATCLLRHNKVADARQLLQKSIGIAEACLNAQPNGLQPRESLMYARNELGDLYREELDRAKARAQFQRTISAGSGLPVGPEASSARRELAYAWMRLGEQSLGEGDLAAARAELQPSLDLRRALLRESGNSSWARVDLALTLRMLGRAELLAGQGEVARTYLFEALELLERQKRVDPNWLGVYRLLCSLYSQIGELALMQGDQETARSYYSKAPKALEDQIGKFESRLLQVELAACYQEMGWLEGACLNPEAVPIWDDRGLSTLGLLAKNEPIEDHPKLSRMVKELERDRAHACAVASEKARWNGGTSPPDSMSPNLLAAMAEAGACLGEHAQAAKLAQRLASRNPGDREILYQAAVIFVRCLSAVTAGKPKAEISPHVRSLQEQYSALAIKTLERTFEQGLGDAERFLRDINLAPLRPCSGFQALIKRAAQRGARE
jgi:serine/threonine-protein kinase